MSVFADTFVPLSTAATEPLNGRLTPTGGAPWTAPTTGAVVTRSGSTGYLSLAAGVYASLSVGNGDVDVSVKGQRLAVRAQSATGKRYELRVTSQTVTGGYYSTETNYLRSYGTVDCGNGVQQSTYLFQCGNSTFPGSATVTCGNGVSGTRGPTGPASAAGTCQVYHSTSTTTYPAQLWVVDAQGRESAVGTIANTASLAGGTLRLRAEGATVTAWVDGRQVAQVDDTDVVSRSRNRIMLGQPTGTVRYTAFVADTLNTAPNAPQTSQPPTNQVVDRTITTRLAWLFNDPDAGDAQSRYDLRFRLLGSSTWSSVTQETPNTFADFAPSTFAEGATYEWQVRTYDRAGLVGPYSAVDYFRAATPPPPPVWVIPTEGGQIPTQAFDVSWSSSAQVAYQVRIDSETENIYDSGRIVSFQRGATLLFPKNRVDRYLSVRVEAGELWSAWAVVKVTVSYTPPAITLLILTPVDDDGCIRVQLRVPVPRGTQPTVLYQELFRTEGAGPEQLVAVNLIGDALWIDWTPASGVNNRYRVIAYGDNGTTSDSGYVEFTTAIPDVVKPDTYTAKYLNRY